MNADYSRKCLEGSAWEYDKALAIFQNFQVRSHSVLSDSTLLSVLGPLEFVLLKELFLKHQCFKVDETIKKLI